MLKSSLFNFLTNTNYFLQIWLQLNFAEKRKILEIIASGKEVILYEKIKAIVSLSLKPENGISFTKDGFLSALKEYAIDDMEWNNSEILYSLLKMRNVSDLNYLYKAQDEVLLSEIMENRFQKKFNNTGRNNSASKLRGCLQREKS